ncbi:hypothetical protein JCM8547_002763 [Rhodosporidiobolus lusitaniae]
MNPATSSSKRTNNDKPVCTTSTSPSPAAPAQADPRFALLRLLPFEIKTQNNGDGTAPKRSRQRQALSCQECRRLKLKCDRVWPCSSCRKRGCSEICPSGVSKPPGKAVRIAAEFSALLRRVDELEALVRELGGGVRIPPPLRLEEALKRSTTVTRELEREIEEGVGRDEEGGLDGQRVEEGEAEEEEEEQKPDEEALRKVLVGVGSLSIAESGRTRFLGPAAGSAYFENEDHGDTSGSELSALETDDPLATENIVRYPFIQLGNAYHKGSEIERLRRFLPPPDEAKRLAENYWNYLSFQFTPVEPSVFWTLYLPSAYTPSSPHGDYLACVFIILSLGSLFDPSLPATPDPQAHHFFVLAHTVLSASRFLSNSTLAAIQTLQLSANYLLNFHDLREGGETYFPLLGMATRMLVVQGLHRDGGNFGIEGEELNRRRRVFYELITLERMQAFISGRPPASPPAAHFDTKFPDDSPPYQTAKWKLGLLIGKVIDRAFSVSAPSYAMILSLDQDLRDLVALTPDSVRSGALPAQAFIVKPTGIPQIPPPPSSKRSEENLVVRQQGHTLDQMFSQVLFYLHKPAFSQALLNNPDEPLRSPWAASVAAVSLETAVYLCAVARSWVGLHETCSRWWHIFFHAFAASVAQSSLVIKSPRSMLAPHAWSQLNEAVSTFELAGSSGAPVAAFVPRLHLLREKAFMSLQNVISVPLAGLTGAGVGGGAAGGARGGAGESHDSPGNAKDVGDSLAEGTDAGLSILGPPTRLERRQPKKRSSPAASSFPPPPPPSSFPSSALSGSGRDALSPVSSSGTAETVASPGTQALKEMLTATGALSAHAPPVTAFQVGTVETNGTGGGARGAEMGAAQPYTPFDEPIIPVTARQASVSSAAGSAGAGVDFLRQQHFQQQQQQTTAFLTPEQQQAAAIAFYQQQANVLLSRLSSSTSPSLPVPPPLPTTSYAPPPSTAHFDAAQTAYSASFAGFSPPRPFPPPPSDETPSSASFAFPPSASTAGAAMSNPHSVTHPLSASLPSTTGGGPLSPPPTIAGDGGGAAFEAFGGFATAFPMASLGGSGGGEGEGGELGLAGGAGGGGGEVGGDAWAWFNSLGAPGSTPSASGGGVGGIGGVGDGLSPLSWDRFGEP